MLLDSANPSDSSKLVLLPTIGTLFLVVLGAAGNVLIDRGFEVLSLCPYIVPLLLSLSRARATAAGATRSDSRR